MNFKNWFWKTQLFRTQNDAQSERHSKLVSLRRFVQGLLIIIFILSTTAMSLPTTWNIFPWCLQTSRKAEKVSFSFFVLACVLRRKVLWPCIIHSVQEVYDKFNQHQEVHAEHILQVVVHPENRIQTSSELEGGLCRAIDYEVVKKTQGHVFHCDKKSELAWHIKRKFSWMNMN